MAKLAKVTKQLAKELRNHIRFEEHEFLPILTKYASAIIHRGILFEHKEVLSSLSDLLKHVGDLGGKELSHDELIVKQSRVKEEIDRILILVEHHNYTQEVIFNLAREAVSCELKPDS